MSNRLNIEQLFSSKLEGLEANPSPSVWKRTARTVRRKQFLRFRAGRFNIYYAGGILLAGTLLTYFLATRETGNPDEGTTSNDTAIPSETRVLPQPEEIPGNKEQNSPELNTREPVNKEEQQRESLNSASKTTAVEAGKTRQTAAEAISRSNIQDTKTAQADEANRKEGQASNEPGNNIPGKVTTLVPYFTPSVYEGCAPLTVEFDNASINASDIKWNFSTPVQDIDPEAPIVTFKAPGTYTIILTAMDPEGVEKSYSETITVHPGPDAVFEIDRGSLFNYSVDASEFSWYVLPEEKMTFNNQVSPFSSVFQPSLEEAFAAGKSVYTKNPYLQLVARNTFGCTDTASTPLPEGSSPELVFPTAFSPNPNGSIGGYYNPNDPDNQVFHPNFNEEPESYQLRIYNKTGLLVFETTDIYIGWDGYYQEAPAPRGVYIYQCTGNWKNGNGFRYSGDITILWNNQ